MLNDKNAVANLAVRNLKTARTFYAETLGLKQVDAATLFGVKQPDVSKMLRGDFRQFSVERLMRFLVALGQDVDIVIRPSSPRQGAQVSVVQSSTRAA